jgi:hypothetical protein
MSPGVQNISGWETLLGRDPFDKYFWNHKSVCIEHFKSTSLSKCMFINRNSLTWIPMSTGLCIAHLYRYCHIALLLYLSSIFTFVPRQNHLGWRWGQEEFNKCLNHRFKNSGYDDSGTMMSCLDQGYPGREGSMPKVLILRQKEKEWEWKAMK